MPVKGFYFAHGDDSDMIEKKWLPDLHKKYPEASWLRYDATVDDIRIGKLTTEYNANALFSDSTVILIRNADKKSAQVESLAEALLESPVPDNALVLISNSFNKTTKLGKLVKKSFIVREFAKPEIKPFDLLDYLNVKNTAKVIQQSNLLFDNGYNPLALFSLLFGQFLLLRRIKEHEGQTAEVIARETKQHVFRVKKTMVALNYWSKEDIARALYSLSQLDRYLRTWQYDEMMLIQMTLINLCLGDVK